MSAVSIVLTLAFALIFLSWLEAKEKKEEERRREEQIDKAINRTASDEIRPIGGKDWTK